MRKRYVASKRHTIQVDFDDYLHELGKERKAGAERARGRAAGSRCRAPRAAAAHRRRSPRREPHATGTGKRERPSGQPRRDPRRRARACSPTSATARRACATSSARTDLATGTFYNYFPDKESVLRALLEEIAAEARARVRAARRGGPTTLEEFVATATARTSSSSPRTRRRSRSCAATRARSARCSTSRRSGAGIDELRGGPRAGDRRRACSRRTTPTTWPRRWSGAGVEVGVRMLERDPPDVERRDGVRHRLFPGRV